jgi:hypothetical protein
LRVSRFFKKSVKDGNVLKSAWLHFVHFFAPINTNKDMRNTGYTIGMIAQMVSPSYFYGFLALETAKEILEKEEKGTFLFRFSSNVGYLACSVNTPSVVMHTKVAFNRTVSGIEYVLEGKSYASLDNLVQENSEN